MLGNPPCNSVEGVRDCWLLVDAGKIENGKTLFSPSNVHTYLRAWLINCAQLIKCAVNNNDTKTHPPPPNISGNNSLLGLCIWQNIKPRRISFGKAVRFLVCDRCSRSLYDSTMGLSTIRSWRKNAPARKISCTGCRSSREIRFKLTCLSRIPVLRYRGYRYSGTFLRTLYTYQLVL
jgi:hypothetical protein